MNTTLETAVRLIASPGAWMEGEALRQFYACANLDGVRQAVGFPDLHPGKRVPVGAAFVTEGLIYPHLIGGDIGCGMTLWQTDLPRRRAKSERWAELPFSLETRWEGNLGGWLQDNQLPSSPFDASMGTLGGGNHFAELQAVEDVHDAGAFAKTGLNKADLALLVHSGSRGYGESICRAHMAEHVTDGMDPESAAGEPIARSTIWRCAGRRPAVNSSLAGSSRRLAPMANASGRAATTASRRSRPTVGPSGFTAGAP